MPPPCPRRRLDLQFWRHRRHASRCLSRASPAPATTIVPDCVCQTVCPSQSLTNSTLVAFDGGDVARERETAKSVCRRTAKTESEMEQVAIKTRSAEPLRAVMTGPNSRKSLSIVWGKRTRWVCDEARHEKPGGAQGKRKQGLGRSQGHSSSRGQQTQLGESNKLFCGPEGGDRVPLADGGTATVTPAR